MRIEDLVAFLSPALVDANWPVPAWPPDAFAIAGSLLHRSGAYVRVLDKFPPEISSQDIRKLLPKRSRTSITWPEWVEEVGSRWRLEAMDGRAPAFVAKLWQEIVAKKDMDLQDISGSGKLARTLLQIIAIADAACWGLGVVQDPLQTVAKSNEFALACNYLLISTIPNVDLSKSVNKTITPAKLLKFVNARSEPRLCASLCSDLISTSRLQVLPKFRTPQCGMSLRSLTHNLALCPAEDILPLWFCLPKELPQTGLNVLLIPWPREVVPADFKSAHPVIPESYQMPDGHGCFRYDRPSKLIEIRTLIANAIERAEGLVGKVHLVVFPELALTKEEYKAVREIIVEEKRILLVAGINGDLENETVDGGCVANCAVFTVPDLSRPTSSSGLQSEYKQRKRHSWCLERYQLVQYGLGSSLSPDRVWWEHIDVSDRHLTFVGLANWLTMCMLICEDLARQDSMAELLRAVGPNLVIALLMDGPQLAERWSARYATVLADDPGSSVLCVTSLGMAQLSRPLHRPEPSRVIALWKDARTGRPVEVSLPHKAEGIVLCLSAQSVTEMTADGRSDQGAAGQLVLSGIHPVVIG